MLGLGLTLTSASPLTVFTVEPPVHSPIMNREKLYLFQRENAFLAGTGRRKHPFEQVQFPAYSHRYNWRAGEPQGIADWGLTPTMGSSESQPCHQGQPWAHSPTRTLQANMSDKFKKLFPKILSPRVQY